MHQSVHCDDVKSIISLGCVWTQAVDGLSNDIISLLLPTPDVSQSEPELIWDDVLKQDALHKSTTGNELLEFNLKSKCIDGSHVTSVSIGEVATAAREASMLENIVMKMIEFNQVNDGLDVAYSGDTVTLEMAFQRGLIPASVYVNILQRQKTCQEMMHDHSIHNEPHLEEVQVNRLILKCIHNNKSRTDRNVYTLTSIGDLDTISNLNSMEVDVADPTKEDKSATPGDLPSTWNNGDRVTVDAQVQCDLMSFSSTLIVLGSGHQFIGLVLPQPNESQFSSRSSESYEESISDVFNSSLISNNGRIEAFYIPESAEVVDINSALQNGYIDVYMADVLKSIEIPDKSLDFERLDEHFSSWLMCRKLRVGGGRQAADLFPSSETKQLFVSYLTLNSYIDSKSQNRVLILDKQLTKMVQFFLEDSVLSENLQHSMEPWNVNASDVAEQGDLEVPFISENSDEMDNTNYRAFDDSLYIEDPDESYHCCNQENPVLPLETHQPLTQSIAESTDIGIANKISYENVFKERTRDNDALQLEEPFEEKVIVDGPHLHGLEATTDETVLKLFVNQVESEEDDMFPKGNCSQPHPDYKLGSNNLKEADKTHFPTSHIEPESRDVSSTGSHQSKKDNPVLRHEDCHKRYETQCELDTSSPFMALSAEAVLDELLS
ncbi:uncharacterized protein LOC144084797 [Stigmatopora argus]